MTGGWLAKPCTLCASWGHMGIQHRRFVPAEVAAQHTPRPAQPLSQPAEMTYSTPELQLRLALLCGAPLHTYLLPVVMLVCLLHH